MYQNNGRGSVEYSQCIIFHFVKLIGKKKRMQTIVNAIFNFHQSSEKQDIKYLNSENKYSKLYSLRCIFLSSIFKFVYQYRIIINL